MTEQGFDPTRHKRILTNLLSDIVKVLGGKVGFKGGTAAFLFYDLPRLSLDLDFDVLQEFTEKEQEKIKTKLIKRGKIKEQAEKRYTLFYLFSYEEGKPNIKLEFNHRVWENNSYTEKWLLGTELKVANEATLFTNKLVALTDRRKPVARDLFDVNFFLGQEFSLSEPLVKERTQKPLAQLLDETIDFIKQNYNSQNVLDGLGEVLDDEQKDWVKSNLVEDTIKKLRERRQQMIDA